MTQHHDADRPGMKTFKVLSAVLDYPTQALVSAVPELRQALAEERLVSGASARALDALLTELEREDLTQLQERYVDLFDRVRSLSLHLFEHVHGESRDRGQAMVDLKQLYERHGYLFATTELPDYVPAFLEFLSCVPASEARELLAETADILQGIGARLTKRGSAYAAVFDALREIAGQTKQTVTVSADEIRAEDDPQVMDALWAEEPAFGPAPECGASAQPRVSVVQVHRRRAA
jgi:nitrate reductase molybdenum cofactor assembly chaperone NarJ/NarW